MLQKYTLFTAQYPCYKWRERKNLLQSTTSMFNFCLFSLNSHVTNVKPFYIYKPHSEHNIHLTDVNHIQRAMFMPQAYRSNSCDI